MLAMELLMVGLGVAIVMANRGRRGITFGISILLFVIGFSVGSIMLLCYGAALMLFGSIEGLFAVHQSRLRQLTLSLFSLSLLSVFLGYTAFLSNRAGSVAAQSPQAPFVTVNDHVKPSGPAIEYFVPESETQYRVDSAGVNIDA